VIHLPLLSSRIPAAWQGSSDAPTARTGSLPRVESADHAGDGMEAGDGIFDRVRSNPRLVIGAAVGALLVAAWIGWAVYVSSDQGARAGLGVLIAWPAMLAALALISLPFIGGYLLIRRLSTSEGAAMAEAAEDDDSDHEESDEEDSDDGQDTDEEEEESDPEAESATS
jgi:hypothetical protein